MLITRVWKNQPGEYFCLSTKSRFGKWADHFFKRSELSKIQEFINDNIDKDVYWCPHGFSEPRRLKENAIMPKLLWADLDEADPRTMIPMPSIAIESSPGRFVGLWVMSSIVEESLNRRLTYHVGADKGGWDVTQVLRVPGTSNYKYDDAPRVKTLWIDGPNYDIAEIERILPRDKVGEINLGDVMRVYKRYEKRLSLFARRNLLRGKPIEGKRSEVLWKLNNELLEAGMTTEEAFTLLVHSPWNKFAGRINGEAQLRRELDKSITQKLESVPVSIKEDEAPKYLTISLADVEEEQLDWIWYPYLARRELSILEGDPGLGKSYLAQMIGAAIVDGKSLPSMKMHKPIKGKVAYFDLENSAGTVTKARLVDNGCKNLRDYYQDERVFRIDDEEAIERVYEGLERVKPDVVVFDTINSYVGKADTNNGRDVQQAMSHFIEIARRFNCATLVLRHLTKSTKEKALYRGQGSIAFSGMARVVMTVGQHPEEEEVRVMAVTKLNVTKRPKALTFEIKSLPDTLQKQDRSKFVWGDFVDLTSDDITISVPTPNGQGRKRNEETEEFLREMLDDGPKVKSMLERAAEARGINLRTLQRAAERLGVIKQTTGFGKTRISTWALFATDGHQANET